VIKEDYQVIRNQEGYVVDPLHEEGVGQGIDNYRDMSGQVHAGQSAVEFPEDGGIAEQQGEYAGFILAVDAHISSIA
jgi:hypothetical protein